MCWLIILHYTLYFITERKRRQKELGGGGGGGVRVRETSITIRNAGYDVHCIYSSTIYPCLNPKIVHHTLNPHYRLTFGGHQSYPIMACGSVLGGYMYLVSNNGLVSMPTGVNLTTYTYLKINYWSNTMESCLEGTRASNQNVSKISCYLLT